MKKDVAVSAAGADKNEIVVYQPEGAEFHIAVRVENETVWLTQAQMAELFHATKQNISLHIAKIFKEGELDPKVVVKEYLTTTQHGAITGKTQVHAVKNYNLDVIISVGYRIKNDHLYAIPVPRTFSIEIHVWLFSKYSVWNVRKPSRS